MKELSEYRARLAEKLVASAEEFREACLAVANPFGVAQDDGWTVHQIAVHVRDVQQLVYGLRVWQTAEQNNPEFKNFDGDAYTRDHYSPDEALTAILNDFMRDIEALAEMLRGLPPSAWSRVSRHEKLGDGLTLQLWVERGLAHIVEHLETVNKARGN